MLVRFELLNRYECAPIAPIAALQAVNLLLAGRLRERVVVRLRTTVE